MSGFLEQMALGSRARLAAARRACSFAQLSAAAQAAPPPPLLRLDPSGFDLIAELKLRSPAAGQLRTLGEDVGARRRLRARRPPRSGAHQPSRFDGALAHLSAAATALTPLGVPAMRKDSWWILPGARARSAGAGGAGHSGMLPRAETSPTSRPPGARPVRAAGGLRRGRHCLMHQLVETYADEAQLLGGSTAATSTLGSCRRAC